MAASSKQGNTRMALGDVRLLTPGLGGSNHAEETRLHELQEPVRKGSSFSTRLRLVLLLGIGVVVEAEGNSVESVTSSNSDVDSFLLGETWLTSQRARMPPIFMSPS